MQVSIIVTNFNYGAYVGQAVASAVAQTHADTEIIVVDDGSTDNSREVLSALPESVKVIYQDNLGQAAAFNAGFAAASGDAIIFLDADDLLLPTAVETVCGILEAQPAVARVQWRLLVIDKQGAAIDDERPPRRRPLRSGNLQPAELAAPFDMAWVPTSGNAFRRTALERILPVPVEYGLTGADWYVVHLSTLLGEVWSLEEPVGCYRIHGGNSHQTMGGGMDLPQLRRTVEYENRTITQLSRLADELALARPSRMLSLSNVANRLILLRLDPPGTPGAPVGIRPRLGLLRDAGLAARRRDDVTWPMRSALLMWCLSMALAPRQIASRLAQQMLSPSERSLVSRVSTVLHHLEHH